MPNQSETSIIVDSVTLKGGVTKKVSGRVQKAISYFVEFADLLNKPASKGKFTVFLSNQEAEATYDLQN